MSDIDTSIVLATCSRAPMLRGAISSLIAEATNWSKPVEIVVVDDGSTDDTANVLADFQRTSPVPFIILAGTRRGVAAARNQAAEHARGVWLAGFDDDQIALPGWLRSLRQRADAAESVCVGGALALQLAPARQIQEFGPRVRRALGETLRSPHPKSFRPASNNVLIRRDVFESLGGYDVSFTEGAEDSNLFDRITAAGYILSFEPEAKALHVTPDARLDIANLRWTSMRLGASEARRFAHRGAPVLLRIAAARAMIALLRDFPQLIWSAGTGNRKLRTDVQCSLWYTQGLLRASPSFLGCKSESSFLHSMDFRARNGERSERTLRAK